MKPIAKTLCMICALIIGIFGTALVWLFYPSAIMRKWAAEMKAGSFDAFFLYYVAIGLSAFGFWKLFELYISH